MIQQVTSSGITGWQAPDARSFSWMDARNLARSAHTGQTDLTGRDYFTGHLDPIAASIHRYGDRAIAAAWLHDIIEDTRHWPTPITVIQLHAWGVPAIVIEAVDAVTRRPDETYKELITRACAHPLGCIVKLADNWYNIISNPGLAQVDRQKAESMLRTRYIPARDRLIAARTRYETDGILPAL